MRKIPRLILAISRSTNWIADLANVRAVPALNLVVVGPSPRRIRAVSPRAETRARTRVSLPRGRGGEQGSDGGRRTKPETQAVPQSLARGDGRGRSTGGEGKEDAVVRSRYTCRRWRSRCRTAIRDQTACSTMHKKDRDPAVEMIQSFSQPKSASPAIISRCGF